MSPEIYLDRNQAQLWLIAPGFDDLLLTGENIEADTGARYAISAKTLSSKGGDALSWGQAQPIDVAVARWMTDGAVAYTQGSDNRTIGFAMRLSASDPNQLGAAEEALQLRAEQPVGLRWIAPAGAPDAPASVFEVWTWHLAPVFDLDGEMRLSRLFTFTGTAKPWARADQLTVVEAVTTSLTPTVRAIDACSSAAGWTGSSTVTSSGGAVKVTQSKPTYGSSPLVNLWMKRTGLVDTTGTPYVRLDMSVTGGKPSSYKVSVDGVAVVKAAQIGSVSWWAMPDGVTSFTELIVSVFAQVTAASATLAVNDVSDSSAAAAAGSAKQTIRHIEVGGAVETAGSVQLAAPDGTTALGWILAATWPDNLSGYSPCLRQYMIAGSAVAADSGAVSGFHNTLLSSGVPQPIIGYSIPPANLPEASYVVVARLKSSVANNSVDLSMQVGASGGFGLLLLPDTVVTLTTANAWQMCILGELTLPAFQLPPESTLPVIFDIFAASGAGNVFLDEMYLIDVTHGDYSLYNAAVSAYSWLDAPDVDPARNRKAIYVGASADRSDAGSVPMTAILNPGDHRLHPLGSNLLVVTDNVNLPVVTASFYRRGNTHFRA